MTLLAQCSNCASWRLTPDVGGHATASNVGHCAQGLAPPHGEPRCDRYRASAAFQQEIIARMLKEEGPMALPVKLVGGRMSARKMRRNRRG